MINDVKTSKSAGPDDIGPKLFKEIAARSVLELFLTVLRLLKWFLPTRRVIQA